MKTLEIAVGFLSTSGGDQEMSIGDYCRGVLLLNEGKSRLKNKKVSNRNKTETLINLCNKYSSNTNVPLFLRISLKSTFWWRNETLKSFRTRIIYLYVQREIVREVGMTTFSLNGFFGPTFKVFNSIFLV